MHCGVGFGSMDINQEINDDLLEYLEDCCRPLCMIFRPFSTVHQAVFDLATLLEFYQISPSNKIEMAFDCAQGPLDILDVYVGKKVKEELGNFVGFLQFNENLKSVNCATYTWHYDIIIAVGRNRLADVVVDIPLHMFPWTCTPFSIDDANVFDLEVNSGYISQHGLARCCLLCRKKKKSCVSVGGMACKSCDPGFCEPSDGEEYGRAQMFYEATAAHAFAFCAPYQHLIQCVKAATKCNKNPKMNSTMRQQLKKMVETAHSNQYNLRHEEHVILNSKSVQTVEFRNGHMKVIHEMNMEGVFGFNKYSKSKHSKNHVTCVSPHLGLATPDKVYSMIDAALSQPGKIFYVEDSLMFKEDGVYTFRPGRIYMVGGIKSEDCITFVVGWTY